LQHTNTFIDICPAKPVTCVGAVFTRSGRLAAIQWFSYDGTPESMAAEKIRKWTAPLEVLEAAYDDKFVAKKSKSSKAKTSDRKKSSRRQSKSKND
jgi:hypothetical protein